MLPRSIWIRSGDSRFLVFRFILGIAISVQKVELSSASEMIRHVGLELVKLALVLVQLVFVLQVKHT